MVRVCTFLAGIWFAASTVIAGPLGESHISVREKLPQTVLGSQDQRFDSAPPRDPLTLQGPGGTYGITAQDAPEEPATGGNEAWGIANLFAGRDRGIQVQAEALFLARARGPANQPLVLDTAGNVLLTTDALDLGTALGPRLTFDFSPDGDRCGEVVYFGMSHGTAAASLASSNNLRLPGDLALITHDFFQADQMHVEYASGLQNLELNGIYHVLDWSWLAGFRYVYFEDTFNIHANNFGVSGSDYHLGTWNNLFGGQLGARVARTWGDLDWDVTGKLGLFANAARTSEFVGDLNNQAVLRDNHLEMSHAAFVADINCSAVYRWNEVWGLRGGVDVMWIDGIALAPDQLDFSSSLHPNSAASYDRGGVCLYGGHLGLEARW